MVHQSGTDDRIALCKAIAQAMGSPPTSLQPLQGGMVGEVYAAQLADGTPVVVKVDRRATPMLAIEGMMLRYLAEQSDLPVPQVYHSEAALLIMERLPGVSRFDAAAEEHAAELLAQLHDVQAPAFGFAQDTLIGLLPQPNPWTDRWTDFYVHQRLLHLGQLAVSMGRMKTDLLTRIEACCKRMADLIHEPSAPSLIHGDIWASNLLAQDGRITGVLDPALYYADPEIELAYILLFQSMGHAFLRRYQALHPLDPAFFKTRIHVYQLYPLLSHVCHFGGQYVQRTATTLTRLGF